MRKHVMNGMRMIGKVPPGSYGTVDNTTTLIKCTSLARLPPSLPESRKAAIRRNYHDDTMGWRLKQMQTIDFPAQHDSVFDAAHAADLTDVLVGVLRTAKE